MYPLIPKMKIDCHHLMQQCCPPTAGEKKIECSQRPQMVFEWVFFIRPSSHKNQHKPRQSFVRRLQAFDSHDNVFHSHHLSHKILNILYVPTHVWNLQKQHDLHQRKTDSQLCLCGPGFLSLNFNKWINYIITFLIMAAGQTGMLL